MGIKVIRLLLPLSAYQRLLIFTPRAPDFTQTWHGPQGAWPHVSPESDDVHNNREGDSTEARPDNVVRVEVPGARQLLVPVIHAVVDVLVLPVALQGPENKMLVDSFFICVNRVSDKKRGVKMIAR